MNVKLATAGAALAVAMLAACGTSASSSAATTASAQAQARPALTAGQVALRMGIGNFTAYTAATDPNHLLGRQHEYTSKINWTGGSIEVFPDATDAQAREAYVKGFTCPIGDGYDYLDGTDLLRLACALTPAQAQVNEKLFKKVIAAA